MAEPKKLSERQLDLLKSRYQIGEENPIGMLLDHIAALEAENAATAKGYGEAVEQFGATITRQADRIKELEDGITRIAALGVLSPGNHRIGQSVGRMCYMRDSLKAMLRGDFSLLEFAEKEYGEDSK